MEEWMLENMDDHQTITLPKWISLAAKWLVQHSSMSPNYSSNDLYLLFCIYPSCMVG